LLFWGLHNTGKFDERTIGYALDYDIADIKRELQVLAEAGTIDKYEEGGVTLYSLTQDETRRRPIIEWAKPGHTIT
jgi:predicted transcriptional regulator